MTRCSRSLVTAVVLGLAAFPACAWAAISQNHTAAGTELARAALLRPSDLGGRWSAEAPAPRKVSFITCSAFAPSVGHVVEVGAAGSATLQRSAAGPFVSETAYVYATDQQEALVWSRVVRPQLIRCLAGTVAGNPGAEVQHTQPLSLTGVGAQAADYRVSGTISASGQTVGIYVDLLVLGHGRTVCAVVVSSFDQPVARSLELRWARAAASRIS